MSKNIAKLSSSELMSICEALAYCREQIDSSLIAVFDDLCKDPSFDGLYDYPERDIAVKRIDHILNQLNKVTSIGYGAIVVED